MVHTPAVHSLADCPPLRDHRLYVEGYVHSPGAPNLALGAGEKGRFFLRNVAIDLQGFRAPQAVMMNAVAPAAIF